MKSLTLSHNPLGRLLGLISGLCRIAVVALVILAANYQELRETLAGGGS
jgi:hypothetical protein